MRGLIICSLLFSAALWAEGSFEQKLKELEEAREESLYKWRTLNKFNNKLPNDQYVSAYNEAWKKYGESELKLHQDFCSTNKSYCLTASQQELKKSQVNIVTGLMSKKNSWAREGVSAEEQKKKETEFKRQSSIDICASHQVGCDKLSEADRKIASEKTSKPEIKPEIVIEKPKIDTKKEESSQEKTVDLNEVVSILEEKLEQDLQNLEAEFEKKHPDFKNKEMTEEAKEFLMAREELRTEKLLEIFKNLCEKYPNQSEVCLTPQAIADIKDDSASERCLIERKFQQQKNSSVLETLTAVHSSEWKGLSTPRSCETLLAKDKKPQVKENKTEEVAKTEEKNEDEKNPRNYRSDSCKWVSDLPRKVINAPGCSTTGRSRVCTGYVVCDQLEGGGKFVRMSTCRQEYCGSSDSSAVRCTKDNSYFSEKPSGEDKLFVTPKMKKILSGSTEQ